MDTLTDLYNEQIVPLDQELEKQASEMIKQAEEEEFAGRIMARGFADEMNKLAEGIIPMGKGEEYGTVKSKSYAQANAGTGKQNISGGKDNIAVNMKRTSQAPSVGSGGEKAIANYQSAKRRPGQDRLAGGPSVSRGKQFKNMQAGGNSAPGAGPKPSAIATGGGPASKLRNQSASLAPMKPYGGAAAKPAVGSVTGKLNLGTIPSMKPTRLAGK